MKIDIEYEMGIDPSGEERPPRVLNCPRRREEYYLRKTKCDFCQFNAGDNYCNALVAVFSD